MVAVSLKKKKKKKEKIKKKKKKKKKKKTKIKKKKYIKKKKKKKNNTSSIIRKSISGAWTRTLKHPKIQEARISTPTVIRQTGAVNGTSPKLPRANTAKPETTITTDLPADSLDTVQLIIKLEKEDNSTIPNDQAEKIATVGDAIAYVEANAQ